MKLEKRQRSPFDTDPKTQLDSRNINTCTLSTGWVAEWTKAAVLKTAVRVTVPGVRIPPHPLLDSLAIPHEFREPASQQVPQLLPQPPQHAASHLPHGSRRDTELLGDNGRRDLIDHGTAEDFPRASFEFAPYLLQCTLCQLR